jgi:integrase
MLQKMPRRLEAKPKDFFFVDRNGHGIRHDFWAQNNWSRICRAAGVRPRRFYATRHTFISVALSHGDNRLEVAEYCGTSMKMIDKHYGAWIGKRGFAKLEASYRKATKTPKGNLTSNLSQYRA